MSHKNILWWHCSHARCKSAQYIPFRDECMSTLKYMGHSLPWKLSEAVDRRFSMNGIHWNEIVFMTNHKDVSCKLIVSAITKLVLCSQLKCYLISFKMYKYNINLHIYGDIRPKQKFKLWMKELIQCK